MCLNCLFGKGKTGYTLILLQKKYNEKKTSMQIQTDEIEKHKDKIKR